MHRRIALIGATGFFGRRLAKCLAEFENVTLVVTSRSAARATQLASELAAANPNSEISGVSFDRDDPAAKQNLAALAPWLAIDASGPFQAAGYGLARAALEMGAHWIDLADARDYLLDFADALDPIAQRHKLVALAGGSSTPALSTAVANELAGGWRRVDAVDIAIMPGGAADVGQSVIRAILSYAGRPIATYQEGKPAKIMGWGSVRRVRTQELGTRYVSPVETADSVLLSRRFAINSRVTFSTGLESRLEQFGLLFLA